MRIEIRGRNVEMTDDLREMVRKRFQRLGRQVSALATLEVVLSEERNPSIADKPRRRGDLLPEGRDPACARGVTGDDAHACANSPRTCGARSRSTATCGASAARRGTWSTRCAAGRLSCIRNGRRRGTGRHSPARTAGGLASVVRFPQRAETAKTKRGQDAGSAVCSAHKRPRTPPGAGLQPSQRRRAKVIATTRAAPAARRAWAQAVRVAPVVRTSSTRRTLRGAVPVAWIRGGWPIRSARRRPT